METLCCSLSLDLRQELAVKEKEKRKPGEGVDLHKDKGSNKENKEPSKIEGTPIKPDATAQTSDNLANLTTASIGTSPLHAGYGSSPLTPSARISALNIVGDLLRKVGVSVYFLPENKQDSITVINWRQVVSNIKRIAILLVVN